MLKTAVQQGAAREEACRTLLYVEPLSAARTTLADFINILPERVQRGYHAKRRIDRTI